MSPPSLGPPIEPSRDDPSLPPTSRDSLDPGPTSITFSGVAIRRPESSLKNAYERLPIDPSDPTDDENSTVRIESGRLIPAPPTIGEIDFVHIDVPSIFHQEDLRFALNGVLGKGGTSRVFAAFDHDLERELAIKVVPRSDTDVTDQLAREARITAKLSHPNVPPIFDVGTVGDDFFLALPLIRGRSLRYRIRQALRAKEYSALPAQELVQVLLKVCDALSYAHARGIIHKDIKPDNIMVGEYGEVMVVDWGSAAVDGEPPDPRVAVGTPAYMAPEQALGRRLDLRADVFALGATLFHALLLRKPVKSFAIEETIARRIAGEFDPPTSEELIGRPRALVAIAQRAMSFNPNERYQHVGAMAEALRAYLAGGDSWSEPILDETFQLDRWSETWHPSSSAGFDRRRLHEEDWSRRSTPPSYRREVAPEHLATPTRDYVEWCLESATEGAALVVYSEVFNPRISIDYEGTMLRAAPPGEITVVWTEDEVLRDDGSCRLPALGSRTYAFRVGAMRNHVAGIFSGLDTPLVTRAFHLHPGRPYRIRIEIDGEYLRLFIDDEPVAEHRVRASLGRGRFGLLATNEGKRFARVRVRERGTPGTVSALAIGDAFYARGLFSEALEEYERVALDPGDTSTSARLLYKRGLCAHQLGDAEGAQELWSQLSGTDWKARVALHQAETCFRAGEHARAVEILREAATEGRNALGHVKETWTELILEALEHDDSELEGYLALRRDLFPMDPSTRGLAARARLAMGQFERVLEEFPSERLATTAARLALGQFEEVATDPEVDPSWRDIALIHQGKLDQVSSHQSSLAAQLVLEGRAKEALAFSTEVRVLLAAGENEQALLAKAPKLRERVSALVRAGRTNDALQTQHPLSFLSAGKTQQAEIYARCPEMKMRVAYYEAASAFLAGDEEKFRSAASKAESLPFSFAWEDIWFDRYFLVPLGRTRLLGESQAFRDSLDLVLKSYEHCFAGRAYFMAAHILGRISDKEFLSQPAKGSAAGRLYLARALRAEMSGDTEEAARAYTVFNSLKRHHRLIDSPLLNPSVVTFCEARADSLR